MRTGPGLPDAQRRRFARLAAGSATAVDVPACQRAALAPGGTRMIPLKPSHDQRTLIDRYMHPVVEPGDFDPFIGPL